MDWSFLDTPKAWLAEFWAVVMEVWEKGVFGVDIGRVLVALAILIGFLLLRRLFTRFVLKRLAGWAARTRTETDNRVLTAIEGPIRFIPIVVGVFMAGQYMAFEGLTETFFRNLVSSLVAFNIFWAFYRLVEPLSVVARRLEKVFSRELVSWLVKAVKVAFIALGVATILETWGIEVAPLIAGLGLFGVAVALGAQDLFKNLISGLLIIGEKRFAVGQWIRVDGVVEGTVEHIGFRSTLVRRFDQAPVYVPNAALSDAAVTNFSAMTYRRIYWVIGVTYDTTLEQLMAIRDGILGHILSQPEFAKPPAVSTFVRVEGFGPSSIDLMVYCFTRTTRWGDWLEIRERLAFEIKRIVEEAGTSFAFPSQSVYVESLPAMLPEDRPEAFPPPDPAQPEASPAPQAQPTGPAA
ncbi:mechanosensitive ion channel family protein [Roseospirillum parvum]|uniref:MscS family membrane protein n=1 Tax=Roseospirillum parvum TaxID=83401 RepID=A0A1G7W4K6_9PROT|nr:mechanosensitive ion channel family protein [Roseospirillum parvum]SDG66821.1 MscS family membrane protein [Roseospirillum parvum]